MEFFSFLQLTKYTLYNIHKINFAPEHVQLCNERPLNICSGKIEKYNKYLCSESNRACLVPLFIFNVVHMGS